MSFTFNVARVTAAAALGRNKATAEDAAHAMNRPGIDPFYEENCADAWDEHKHDSPEDLYCSYGKACDSVDLDAANIGPTGDTQCRDCNAVEDAKGLAFERENAHYM